MSETARYLRFAGSLLLQALLVLIGTAILEPLTGERLIQAHTLNAILLREYICGLLVAGFLGFLVYRVWQPAASLWIWLFAACWMSLRVITLFGSQSSLFFQLSGVGCENGTAAIACRNWFIFTIPTVRAAGYSLGALFASRVLLGSRTSLTAAFLVRFRRPSEFDGPGPA
jgi:hypothetical protein